MSAPCRATTSGTGAKNIVSSSGYCCCCDLNNSVHHCSLALVPSSNTIITFSPGFLILIILMTDSTHLYSGTVVGFARFGKLDMSSSSRVVRVLRFDIFELDVRAGELRKQGIKIRLQGQALQVLEALLRRSGDLVTREELRAEIWKTVAEILMKGAQIAILDEPTSGLDPHATAELLAIIRGFKNEGVSVLLSSHLLERVQSVCDRVALFSGGRIALKPALANLAAAFGSSLLIGIFLGSVLPNIVLAPLGRMSRTIDSILSGRFEASAPSSQLESPEFADVRAKLNVLGEQFRGAKQDASELRSNIEQLLQRLEGRL